MEQVVQIVFIFVGIIALFLVMGILMPGVIKSSRENFDKTPARAFGVGLATILVFAALFVGSVELVRSIGLSFLNVLVVLVILFFSIGIVVGLTAATQTVGARLFPNQAVIMQNIYGVGLVILASLIPYFGRFILLPFLLILWIRGLPAQAVLFAKVIIGALSKPMMLPSIVLIVRAILMPSLLIESGHSNSSSTPTAIPTVVSSKNRVPVPIHAIILPSQSITESTTQSSTPQTTSKRTHKITKREHFGFSVQNRL